MPSALDAILSQVEYVEDLEEDDSDIEDTAEWGGSYWGAPGSAGGQQGAEARGGDSDSEQVDEEDGALGVISSFGVLAAVIVVVVAAAVG